MHVEIAQVTRVRCLVFHRRQSAEALLVDISPQRVYSTYKNIDTQIKFQIVDKEWLVKISLDDKVVVRVQVIQIPCQKDASPLTRCLGLNYKSFLFILLELLELLSKVSVLRGKQPSLGEEIVVFWKALLHPTHISSEQVLPAQYIHAWKMVDSLVRLHPVESVALDSTIRPQNVPVFFVLISALDSIHFGDCSYHWIMALVHIDKEPPPPIFSFVPFFLANF